MDHDGAVSPSVVLRDLELSFGDGINYLVVLCRRSLANANVTLKDGQLRLTPYFPHEPVAGHDLTYHMTWLSAFSSDALKPGSQDCFRFVG